MARRMKQERGSDSPPVRVPAPGSPSWESTVVPKVRHVAMSTLGQEALTDGGRNRKLPRAALKLDQAGHGRCVDHVKVPGLSKAVCILRGQEAATVVAEARQLAGLDR